MLRTPGDGLNSASFLFSFILQEVLINVAPKKANWDLRRDIAGSLARLERRTQVRGPFYQSPPGTCTLPCQQRCLRCSPLHVIL